MFFMIISLLPNVTTPSFSSRNMLYGQVSGSMFVVSFGVLVTGAYKISLYLFVLLFIIVGIHHADK